MLEIHDVFNKDNVSVLTSTLSEKKGNVSVPKTSEKEGKNSLWPLLLFDFENFPAQGIHVIK